MLRFFVVLFLFVISGNLLAQNVGHKGDTLLNYKDINGLKQGHWEKKYSNGEVKYKAYFVNDKAVGDLKRYDSYGNLMAHLVYDNKGEYAIAKFYHRSGKVAGEGKYFGKIRDSIWNYYDDKGTHYLQESFKIGVKHGKFLQITAEGVIIEETNWVDGVKHGSWIKRYVEGPKMWEATYVNGKIEGMTKTYYKSGGLHKVGKFVNDLMHGAWKKYSESGNLKKIYVYKNGHCPEAEEEQNKLLEELEQNKDKYTGPRNGNDLDWLKGTGGY